jgi:uncharacterized protein YgiB involved in biofilm formation
LAQGLGARSWRKIFSWRKVFSWRKFFSRRKVYFLARFLWRAFFWRAGVAMKIDSDNWRISHIAPSSARQPAISKVRRRKIRARTIRSSLAWGLAIPLLGFLLTPPSQAQSMKGAFTYSSAHNCVSSGKLSPEICGNAEANAAAEFEEKAPRFATRGACEQAHASASCSIGFRGADGWAGRKNAVYFTLRQQGFLVTVKSEHDVVTVPLATGLTFSPRSALRRDASIKPQASRNQPATIPPRAGGRPAGKGAFGVSTPEGAKSPLPPPPPVDPNFDCAALLEPSAKGDPNTGCALAPNRRR